VNRFRIALGLAGTLLMGVLASRLVDAQQPVVPPPVPAAAREAPVALRLSASPQAPSSQAPSSPQAPASPPAGFAGADTCLVCHEAEGNSIKSSPHGNVTNVKSPMGGLGCESCHGPGQAHVDDDNKGHIVKFGQLKPDEISQTSARVGMTRRRMIIVPQKGTKGAKGKTGDDFLCGACGFLRGWRRGS